MGFADAKGQTSGAVTGLLDVTHRGFEPALHDLLPRGLAWDPEDPLRRALVASQGTELSRVDIRAQELQRELDPHTTFALIDDWETELGLPECSAPETLEARRGAVLAKLLAEGGHNQSETWWADFLTSLGYPPKFFLQGQDVMTCIDDCVDELTDEEWMFVWAIFIWNGVDDALLLCFVNHNALIGTLPLVHFMWQPVVLVADPHQLNGVAVTSKGFVAAVGNGPYIVTAAADYDDPDGTGWNTGTPDPGALENLYAVAAIDDVLVACGVNPANFYRSTDHGATWVSTGTPTEEMNAISPGIGPGVALAAGENGVVWRSVNYGESWSLVASPAATVIFGLTRCTGAVLAVAENNRVYRSTNNGTSWTNTGSAGVPLRAVGAWLLVVIAVGDGGVIVRSTNGGQSFTPVASPTTASLRGVVGTPEGRWTACGLGGVILQSLDDGETWVVQPSPTTEDLRAVTRHVPSDRAIIVGDNLTIFVE